MIAKAIVISIDENYRFPASVLIGSIASHSNDTSPIIVLDCGLSRNTAQSLISLGIKAGRSVTIRRVNDKIVDMGSLPIGDYFTSATWARLLIPEVCSEFNRCLYLDADCLVRGDLTPLLEADLGKQALGAVPDVFHPDLDGPVSLPGYCHPGPEKHLRYFNAGVLLIDVDRWREQNISRLVLDFARSHRYNLRFYDQDALNAVLAARWKELPSKWNVPPIRDILTTLKFDYLGADYLRPEQFAEAEARASIIHFVTELKPWMPDYPHSEHWVAYQSATGSYPPSVKLGPTTADS